MIDGKTNYVRTTAATVGLTDQVKSSLSSTYRKNGSPLRSLSLSSDEERQRKTKLTVSGLGMLGEPAEGTAPFPQPRF